MKKSGCLTVAGILASAAGLLLLLLSIFGMYASEKEMDRNRELYAASEREIEAYYADSLKQARYDAVLDEIDVATEKGDSLLVAALQDSLFYYSPPAHYGNIGFNIFGAFLMIPALVALVMMGIGITLIIAGVWVGRRNSKIDKV